MLALTFTRREVRPGRERYLLQGRTALRLLGIEVVAVIIRDQTDIARVEPTSPAAGAATFVGQVAVVVEHSHDHVEELLVE